MGPPVARFNDSRAFALWKRRRNSPCKPRLKDFAGMMPAMAGPIHYEVYVRKTAPSAWSLLIATEDRKHAMETAEDQMNDRLAVAVRLRCIAQALGERAGVVFAQVLVAAQFAHVAKLTGFVTDLSDEGDDAFRADDMELDHRGG